MASVLTLQVAASPAGRAALVGFALLAAVLAAVFVLWFYRARARLRGVSEELRASVSTYRSLIDSVNELVFIHEVPTGRFIDVNRSVVDALEFGREEIVGATPALIADPDRVDLAQGFEAFQSAASGTPQRFEWWARTRNGRTLPLDISLVGGTYFGQGVIIAVARDISARVASEETIRIKDEQYRDIFEADLVGNFVGRPDGTLEACNGAFCRIVGYETVEEALELGFGPLAAHSDSLLALLQRLRTEGRIEGEEFEFRRRDGARFRILLYARGAFEDGELVRFHGHGLDITQQKAMAERVREAQKMEAVGLLAGGIAHDFNNVLTTIQGHSELLLEELPDEAPGREGLHEIRQSAERAGRLTRRLIAFSRRRVLRPRLVDLAALVRDATGLLERALGEDIHLALQIDPDVGRIHADPGEIEQVLSNLVINAREALPAGGIVQVRVRSCSEGDFPAMEGHGEADRYALLQVQDDGVGMDERVRDRAFEPFFTTKTNAGGSGLGLATVYGVVQEAAGAVWVESEPGAGTTVSVCFPCVQENAPGSEDGATTSSSVRRVLLAEDEVGVRKLSRRVLEGEGFEVVEAEDGQAALELALADPAPFGLLLTDVVMPRLRGTDLADRLRERQPRLPVLFVSGYTEADQLRAGALAEGQRFLAKPFSPAELREAVRELLRRPVPSGA